MRDREYAPLLLSGFQDIQENDFEDIFVKRIGFQNSIRTKLVQDFVLFLSEFKRLNIKAEV